MKSPLFKTVCYAVALAMGVVVIVTNIISPLAAGAVTTMLAIGLGLVGLVNLQ